MKGGGKKSKTQKREKKASAQTRKARKKQTPKRERNTQKRKDLKRRKGYFIEKNPKCQKQENKSLSYKGKP